MSNLIGANQARIIAAILLGLVAWTDYLGMNWLGEYRKESLEVHTVVKPKPFVAPPPAVKRIPVVTDIPEPAAGPPAPAIAPFTLPPVRLPPFHPKEPRSGK